MVKKLILAIGLVLLSLGERLWFDLGPNVELVMLTSVLASMYLGRRWGVGVALLSLGLSDLVIGNTMIMVFTWSAMAVIGWAGRWLRDKSAWWGAGYGLAGAVFFYLYTNLGVWLIGGLYEQTLVGLVRCYVMGLPFLKLHAASSMLLLPAGLWLVRLVVKSSYLENIRQNWFAEDRVD